MAVCDHCEREMAAGVPCVGMAFTVHGEARGPVPNGDVPCHDCLTPSGGLHHPGCDMERCPFCGGQAISCDCADDGGADA